MPPQNQSVLIAGQSSNRKGEFGVESNSLCDFHWNFLLFRCHQTCSGKPSQTLCPSCAKNLKLYGKPSACTLCTLTAAFKGDKCKRWANCCWEVFFCLAFFCGCWTREMSSWWLSVQSDLRYVRVKLKYENVYENLRCWCDCNVQ